MVGQRRRGWPRVGTAARLAGFHALVIVTVLGIVVFQFTQIFAQRYLSTITTDLGENVTAFSRSAATRPAAQSLSDFARTYLASRGSVPGDYTIISLPTEGTILSTAGGDVLSRVASVADLLRHPPAQATLSRVQLPAGPEQVLATPIVANGASVGTFLTASSLADYEQTRRDVLLLGIGEGLVTLLAAITSVYVLLRRLLGSVNRLTQTAQEIGLRGELDLRLDDQRTGDEVGEMAATFDAMVERIGRAMAVQRRLLADVSHQLRTPLTVMRGHLEVLDRGRLDDPAETRATVELVLEELTHMSGLVERLLLLGRSLEVDFTDPVPVDVRALLHDIGASATVIAPRDWRVGPVADVVVTGDLEKLRGAVLNLVDNAVKVTGPQDTIELSATVTEQGRTRMVEICVEDSGPGIPPADRETALGRFHRGQDATVEGTGLGLAIVEAVARAHGGQARIGDSPLGGARVSIVLPLAPEAAPAAAARG